MPYGPRPKIAMLPEVSTGVWAACWEAAGLAGGVFLIFGLLLRAVAARLVARRLGDIIFASMGK